MRGSWSPPRGWLWLVGLLLALVSAVCQAVLLPRTRPPETPPKPTELDHLVDLPVPYRAQSPEPGGQVFVWDHPGTTERDLGRVAGLGFGWQKSLFQWRKIEGACKGCFDWTEADRVVRASERAGLKVIARLDYQPKWASPAHNGPPEHYQDFADFVYALVSRYRSGSPHGRVHAIKIWNEVNLAREWGNQPIGRDQAADYVRLLQLGYRAAKAADPRVMVLTSGLAPTGWDDHTARPDDVFLQWLYDEGMRGYYDALFVHANAQAPEPEAAPGALGEPFDHPSFYFRRVEHLREIMVRNGDGHKQVWLEFGWTSDRQHPEYAWYAVPEERKGENLVRALRYARQHWAPWVGVMSVWTLPDPSWTSQREEWWWAIADPDGTPRPSYDVLRDARAGGLLP